MPAGVTRIRVQKDAAQQARRPSDVLVSRPWQFHTQKVVVADDVLAPPLLNGRTVEYARIVWMGREADSRNGGIVLSDLKDPIEGRCRWHRERSTVIPKTSAWRKSQ